MTNFLARAAAAASLLALPGLPALAGGLATAVVPPAPMAPVTVVAPAPMRPSADWTGVYVGAQLDFGNFSDKSTDEEASGQLYGLQAGYQRDFGRFVLGGQVDYDWANDVGLDSGANLDSVTRARLRMGYDAGRILPYATVGYANATVSGNDQNLDGYVYGIGADYAVTDSVAVGAEFLQHEFQGGDTDADRSLGVIGLHASYRF